MSNPNRVRPLAVGDVVRAKAGGPKMTVTYLADANANSRISCVWFNKETHLQEAYFPPEALVRVTTK